MPPKNKKCTNLSYILQLPDCFSKTSAVRAVKDITSQVVYPASKYKKPVV